jgi:kynurenine formamidase
VEREKTAGQMSGIIKLSHGHSSERTAGSFCGIRAMVLQSVGPFPHEVSVPFHDSQVRKATLLIQTGWDQFWATEEYWSRGPVLAEHLIFRCVRSGVRLLGVDFPIGDRTTETRLITTGTIPIVENLCGLNSLPRTGFQFSAVPLESAGAVVAVHAFAEIT